MPNNSTVDERVVEMRIDNRQFVKGAEKTISVLDKLKAALNFKGASKDLDDLEKTSSKIDFSNMTSGITKVSTAFNALEIAGKRAIENLTDSVYGFAKRTVKGLSTDQLAAGWSKYESIIESTQTIMSATRGAWEENIELQKEYGTQLDYVNHAIEMLNWFTDETSYNLTDMTSNIGKFTSIGEDLDSAVMSMQGIATWAGLAGANATEASRAMYNISQAMGAGKMLKIDWKSIENAGMATEEFKQTALEVATVVGDLTKESDGVYKTAKGITVTTKNFAETLSEGWFDSNVMRGTFKRFGEFSTILSRMTDETGLTATELLKQSRKFQEGELDIKAWQDDLFTRMDEEEVPSINALTYAMEVLNDQELDLGRRAFEASQMSKTFTDALNATKDAVSTGWMNTFKFIFGDLEEAKKLWTSVTEELYDIFASGGERRNAIMKIWHDSGGRDALLKGLANIYHAVRDFIAPFKEAFNSIFSMGAGPRDAANRLVDLTKGFEAATERFSEFMAKLRPSEDVIAGLKTVFSVLASAVRSAFGILKKAAPVFASATRWLGSFASALFSSFKDGRFDIKSFGATIKTVFANIKTDIGLGIDSLVRWFESFKDVPILGNALGIIAALTKRIKTGFAELTGKLSGIQLGTIDLQGPLAAIDRILGNIKDAINGVVDGSGNIGDAFRNARAGIADAWKNGTLFGDQTEFRENVQNFFVRSFTGLGDILKQFVPKDIMSGLKTGVLIYLSVQLAKFVKNAGKTIKNVRSYSDQIHDILSSVQGTFDSFSKSITQKAKSDSYLKMAAAVGILAGSIFLLSKVPDEKFMAIAVALSFLFIVLSKTVKSMENISLVDKDIKKLSINVLPKMAANLAAMAIFVGVCVAAMMKIAKLNDDEFLRGLIALFSIITFMTASLAILSNLFNKDMGIKQVGVIVAFSGAIMTAALALMVLSIVPWQKLLVAAFSLGLVIAALGGALLMLNDYNSGLGAIGAILALAAAIDLLIPAMTALSAFGPERALASALAISAVMLAMSMTLKIVDQLNPEKLSKFTTNLIKFSVAVLLLSIALAVAAPAIISLTTAFVGFFAAFRKTKDFGKLRADLWEFAKVCGILGLAAIPLIAVGIAFMAFGAALLLAGAGVFLLSAGLALLAPAIGVLTVALVPFGAAITEFCDMLAENGDTILTIIASVITGVIAIIMIKKYEVSIALLSVIFTLIAVIIAHGPEIMNAIAIVLQDVLGFLVGLIPMFISFIVLSIIAIINGVANSLRNNMGALLDAVENLISVILEAVVQVFFRLAGDILTLLFHGIGKLFGLQDVGPIARGIKDSFDQLGEDVAAAIRDDLVDESALNDSADKYKEILSSGLEETREDVGTQMQGVAKSITEQGHWNENGYGAGVDFSSGTAAGVLAGIPGVNGAIDQLTTSMTTHMQGNLGIHSPSRVAAEFGRFFNLGLAEGVADNVSVVDSPTQSLSERLKEALKLALQSAMATDESWDLSPTITPVVDMSAVNDSADAINQMFSGAGNGTIRAGSRISGDMSNLAEIAGDMQDLSDARASISNDSYIINVYPTPGMDEGTVADMVIARIQNGMQRKGAAFG